MRTLKFILISSLTFSPLAEGKEIAYRPETQSAEEFNSLKLAHLGMVGYDEYLAGRIVPREMKENLSRAYLRAQDRFLKSEIGQMESEWRDVTAFAFKADWSTIQREMIQISYLRLAQIAATPDETRRHLLSVFEFDSEYQPDRRLFPPPLVEQYLQIRKTQSSRVITTKNFEGFTILLVNGQRFDLESVELVEISEGTKRITFLSPTYAPVTRVLAAHELESYRPQKILLPQARAPLVAKESEGRPSLSPQLASYSNQEPSIENSISTTAGSSQPFYQKPTFWVVTAAIAGAILYVNSRQRENERSPPTEREGF